MVLRLCIMHSMMIALPPSLMDEVEPLMDAQRESAEADGEPFDESAAMIEALRDLAANESQLSTAVRTALRDCLIDLGCYREVSDAEAANTTTMGGAAFMRFRGRRWEFTSWPKTTA